MTPTGRTMDLMRRSGYLAAVVERWIPHANKRRDLFGAFDVLAIHPVRREVVLIQVSTAAHLPDRLAKVQRIPELPAILAAGVKVSVHGWDRRGGGWHCRIVDVVRADLPAVIVAKLPRRPRSWQQPSLFAGPGAGPCVEKR